MKRLFFIFALVCMQVVSVFAQGPTSRVNSEKVRMYRQPVLGGEVVRVLGSEDEIIVMRKQNNEWSLVQIDGEAGYVLNAYLKAKKAKKATAAKTPEAPGKSAKL
ncbi:SH3 domain-containing protein [Rufibacter sp. XAAS-G3-1]|uniref:SH3 domain-containing protein n=1 Tax=Rufibacter sp. XAAS-G3-1 TaxID=2729134 RepID=UPI0015E77DB2|nr:SH3 domain-containing protein [Rufibacter sp. XAAS-G3-1]